MEEYTICKNCIYFIDRVSYNNGDYSWGLCGLIPPAQRDYDIACPYFRIAKDATKLT